MDACPEYPDLFRALREAGMPKQRAALADVPGAGRGLVAAEDVKPGDTLLSVPIEAALTVGAARAGLHADVAAALPPDASTWTVLALFLGLLRLGQGACALATCGCARSV